MPPGFPLSESFRRSIGNTDRQDLAAALFLTLFSGGLLFALMAAWPSSMHDSLLHYHRIRALAEALREGLILPRWLPTMLSGLGEPTLNYYSPSFYWAPALLKLSGLELLLGLRLTLAAFFALSAWWMFHFLRLFVSIWPAIVGVISFQLFPYRLYDLFMRGAFPEFAGFTWLPLVGLYTALIVNTVTGWMPDGAASGTSWRNHSRSCTGLLARCSLAWAALILTHNLTAMMAALVLAVSLTAIAILQGRNRVFRTSGPFLAAAPLAVGALVSAWYSLPALLELKWVLNGNGIDTGRYLFYFSPWAELFDLHLLFDSYSMVDHVKLPLYVIPVVIGALVAVVFRSSNSARRFIVGALLLTLASIWMSSETSSPIWTLGRVLLEKLQLPWRWHIFVAFGTAGLLAALMDRFRSIRRLPAATMPLLALCACAYLLASSLVNLDYETVDNSSLEEVQSDSFVNWLLFENEGQWGRDFMPIWLFEATMGTDRNLTRAPDSDSSGDVQTVETLEIAPTRVSLLRQSFEITTTQPFRLLFPQLYFPAWHATLDGESVQVQPATGFALASITVPTGTHLLEFGWRTTSAAWAGRALTAAGWVTVFLLFRRAGRKSEAGSGKKTPALGTARWRWDQVGWTVVGGLMLTVSSGIAERRWSVEPIGADYGIIRLEGVRSVPPVRAGEVASVRLIWLVKGEEAPVSAFVHLVDETGAGLSQHDGPPVAEHMRYGKWVPGLILYSTHSITVPGSLAPGTYRLVAGLYYPDQGHEPIVPLDGRSPRLEIGTVEVLR